MELLRGGVVKLVGSSHQRPLRFRISVQEAKRMLELKKTPTIHFAHEDISLHIDNDVVCRKPIEQLLASLEGPEWLLQITREFEDLPQMLPGRGDAEEKAFGKELTVLLHKTCLGIPWKNGELRRKLR